MPFFVQCQSNVTKGIIKEISKEDQIHDSYVGLGGVMTDHYLNFVKLRDHATMDDLVNLTKSKNKVVACYAAWALCDKKYNNIESIFEYFLNKNQSVKVSRGCIIGKDKISSEVYHRIFNAKYLSPDWRRDSIYYTSKLSLLDSIILYNKNSTRLLIHRALDAKQPKLENYSQIKKLAFRKKNEDALIALAKFNNENDIPKIKKTKTNSFLAIAEFPHSDFWDFLLTFEEDLFTDKFNSVRYLIAIASFENQSSLQFLKRYAINDEHVSKIHEAITYKRDPFYFDFLIELWERNRIIDLTTLSQIQSQKSNKVLEIVENGLLNFSKELKFRDTVNDYSSRNLILPIMLNILKENKSNELVEIVNKNLMNSEFYELESICNFIVENEMNVSISTVLNKMETEPKAFEMFELTKVILSFEDSEINQRLKLILIKHRSWDWGNWSNAFRKLLSANNIEIG